MRKLASIQRIRKLEPVPNADSLEKATVLGWQVVVKKGEFKEGELVVYVEIDSVLPDWPEFEFLKPRGMRVKTIKLRGQISQGICFPLSITQKRMHNEKYLTPIFIPVGCDIEGIDFTEWMAVEKYEPPVKLTNLGIPKGNFPDFIRKTDKIRYQTIIDDLEKLSKKELWCHITEKLDGTSVTYYVKDGQFGVCSRNLELKEDNSVYWKMAKENNIEDKLRGFNQDIAIQGEIIGPNIQKNKYKLENHEVYFFDIYDIERLKYRNYFQSIDIFRRMQLKFAPSPFCLYELSTIMKSIEHFMTGFSEINRKTVAEGFCVVCDEEEYIKEHGRRLEFKVINPEFLLEHGE